MLNRMTHMELQDVLLKSGEFQLLYTHISFRFFFFRFEITYIFFLFRNLGRTTRWFRCWSGKWCGTTSPRGKIRRGTPPKVKM